MKKGKAKDREKTLHVFKMLGLTTQPERNKFLSLKRLSKQNQSDEKTRQRSDLHKGQCTLTESRGQLDAYA